MKGSKVMAEHAPTTEQNPDKGGSYIRKPDGSLELREGPKPVDQDPRTEPAAPATDTPSEE